MIVAPILLGVRSLTQLNIFIAIGLPLGGVGNFVASMFAYAEGNTYAAAISSVLGGIFGGLSLAFLPWTGIQAAYLASQPTLAEGIFSFYKAIWLFFLVSMLPVFLLFLASFKTAAPIAGGALMMIVALTLNGVSYLEYPQVMLQKACGGLVLVVSIFLWYTALTVMNQEEGINVPIIALPRHDD